MELDVDEISYIEHLVGYIQEVMGFNEVMIVTVVVVVGFVFVVATAQDDYKLVPAIITFGDSTVDIGNNNNIKTVFKANRPPYGRDFPDGESTGRFCNGKLATDFTAETLGFNEYPPAYLSPEATGKNLLIGANFASAGSGFDEKTAMLSRVISLSAQVEYFKEYQRKLVKITGSDNANTIITEALYIVSFGSSDFLQNYYINPILQKKYTPAKYSSKLVGIFTSLVDELYEMGARRIGVTSLPPLGCIPAAITLFGGGLNTCITRLNDDARRYNRKLNSSVSSLSEKYSDLNIAVLDIYQPLLDLILKPSDSGFAEARRGCCGTGIVETTVLLCTARSPGTCANATEYVFWDAVHPSEAANEVLAEAVLLDGISLVT